MDTNKILTEISEMRQRLSVLEILEQALTSKDLPEPKRVTVLDSKLAKYILAYEVYNLEDVKSLIGQIWNSRSADILSLSLCRDGATHSFLTPYHGRTGEITPVFPVTVSVSKYGIKFEFYVLIEDAIVQVRIDIPEGFKSYAQVHYTQKQPWHHVKRASIEYPAFNNPNYIFFGSGSPVSPPSYTLFWENATSLDQIFS